MTSTPQSHWFTQSAVDEITAGLKTTLEARTAALHRTIARAEKAEAKLRKVEALVDKWEREVDESNPLSSLGRALLMHAPDDLRAVLEGGR